METSLPLNTEKSRIRKNKKRTAAFHGRRSFKFAFGTGYVLAALILFQFVTVQLALVFFEESILGAQALTPPPVITQVNTLAAVKAPPKTGLPVRLSIPSLKVNALIRYVGLAANGAMGVPTRANETAWYKLGPKPGEVGSSVIAGHVSWLYGAVGIFSKLDTLKPGDKISILDDKGVKTTFVVRRTKDYLPRENASDVFVSSDGIAHLNLVTCAGVWDRLSKEYTKRHVVFTDKVEE